MSQAIQREATPSSLKRTVHWLLKCEGSTRALAIMRLFIVANVWARWGDEHVLYRDLNAEALLIGGLFFLSTIAAFFGIFTSISMAGVALVTNYFVYVQGHLYGHEPYTHHHTTLLANVCLLLALAPCGRSLSVDRWMELNRAEKQNRSARPERANLWVQRLLALQVVSIYFWGAVDKTNLTFLSGDRMQHYLMYYYTGPVELNEFIPGSELLMRFLAIATVGLEYALAFGLLISRYRKWLLIPGLLLHGVFYLSLSVFTYTTTMWALYLAVIEPDEFDRALDRLLERGGCRSPASSTKFSEALVVSPRPQDAQ